VASAPQGQYLLRANKLCHSKGGWWAYAGGAAAERQGAGAEVQEISVERLYVAYVNEMGSSSKEAAQTAALQAVRSSFKSSLL
jgi:hypothetical protein